MSQQTWFITGTTSGFGRQLNEILLARGDQRRRPAPAQTKAWSDLKAQYGDQGSLDRPRSTSPIRRRPAGRETKRLTISDV